MRGRFESCQEGAKAGGPVFDCPGLPRPLTPEVFVNLALLSLALPLLCSSLPALVRPRLQGTDPGPREGTAVGQRFPDLALPRLRGGSNRLSDHRGRKVFLLVFASW